MLYSFLQTTVVGVGAAVTVAKKLAHEAKLALGATADDSVVTDP